MRKCTVDCKIMVATNQERKLSLGAQGAVTQDKMRRAMKAHGIVALRKRLRERGATDLPELSTTHQRVLSGLSLEHMVRRKMTPTEWAEYADYVLAVAKDAQKSLAVYKRRVRERCKAELAELHAVHRHMPRDSTRKQPTGRGATKSTPSATRRKSWVYPPSGNKPKGMSLTEWRTDPKNPNNTR